MFKFYRAFVFVTFLCFSALAFANTDNVSNDQSVVVLNDFDPDAPGNPSDGGSTGGGGSVGPGVVKSDIDMHVLMLSLVAISFIVYFGRSTTRDRKRIV